jgi:hypothetical protein
MFLGILSVMKDSDNFNLPGAPAIEQKMAGRLYAVASDFVTTESQMVRAASLNNVRTTRRTQTFGISSNIVQRAINEPLISQSRRLAKIPAASPQNLGNVAPGNSRKPNFQTGIVSQLDVPP